mmetsp:Transcript_16290/g.35347  ORF Transcript_16290/g.35347 Transcript_16290/m.35347 type:complete len:286 (-) Transcript_16290:110-967(-)
MCEIEAQFGRVHERTLLVAVLLQHVSEGPVERMSCGVVCSDQRTTLKVHVALHLVGHDEGALGGRPDVQHVSSKLLNIFDDEPRLADADLASVEDLTTLLRVEVCCTKNEPDTCLESLGHKRLTVPDGDELGLVDRSAPPALPVVLRLVVCRRNLELRGELVCRVDVELECSAAALGLLALLLFLLFGLDLGDVPRLVDCPALLLGHELRQVQREPKRRVECESVIPRHDPTRWQLLGDLLEHTDTSLQRDGERLLLGREDALYASRVATQLGEGTPHRRHNRTR